MSIVLNEYPDNMDEKFLGLFSAWWERVGIPISDLLKNPWYGRHYTVWQYAKYLSDLEGDFVECGVYNGSTAQFMASECKTTLHLVDSWEGLSELGENDNPMYDEPSDLWAYRFALEIEETQYNLRQFDNLQYHKGWIPEVLTISNNISMLHLDLDLYQPTKDSLEYFWDKMTPGGVVICDTHENVSWGAEKATRDFFEGIRDIEMSPTGQAIIVK